MTIKPVHACCCLLLAMSTLQILHAQGASPADKTFVSKVSQGGAYEVEASRLAELKANAQDVKDQAVTEVHDHGLVNRELQKVASAKGIQFPAGLNASFEQRLDKLRSTPSDQFDRAYIADMEEIHDGDEKLFAQEAQQGGSPEFKAFAHKRIWL